MIIKGVCRNRKSPFYKKEILAGYKKECDESCLHCGHFRVIK